MNVKRFTARTSREALALVKQEFGDDAVVMSTRPCPQGVEVVAMAGDSVEQLERVGAAAEWVQAPRTARPARRASAAAPRHPVAPQPEPEPAYDDEDLPSWASEVPAAPPAPSRLEAAARLLTRARQRMEPPLEPVEPAHAPAQRGAGNTSPLSRVLAKRNPAPSGAAAWDAERAAAAQARQPQSNRQLPEPASAPARREPPQHQSVHHDVEQLQMSTLSFQDYVRQRMLKRREAEMAVQQHNVPLPQPPTVSAIDVARKRQLQAASAPARPDGRTLPVLRDEVTLEQLAQQAQTAAAAEAAQAQQAQPAARPTRAPAQPTVAAPAGAATRRDQTEMMSELRSMRGLIEQRFGALAFMEKLQRQPRQAHLAQRLLAAGFSPALIRRLVDGLPVDVDESDWASTVLERNLTTGQNEASLEEQGGVFAVIGATGVGKTTSTAKLAAAFATRYGAANLGLITLDAYRVGAHEQLRTYGRILGVPVHTAHDRASLEDLLELLSAKRMILIDTAGMAQRDSRTRELLDMVSQRAIKRLLVINASAQGETIEDQLAAYAAQSCHGVVLSKLDEAVKLAPALDSMVRHKLKVVAVANGQRVPEDWHRLSASALVQRALKGGGSAAWNLNDNDVNLIFAGMPNAAAPAAVAGVHA